MSNKTKNIRWAIVVGFIFSSLSITSPFLFDSDYVNNGKWHLGLQWLVLWVFASGLIFCIDNIGRKIKKEEE